MDYRSEKHCGDGSLAAHCCKRAQTDYLLPLIMIRSLKMAAAPIEVYRLGMLLLIRPVRICHQYFDIAISALNSAI
jgi:hypothetical protein